jgi:hypothetical protein
MSKFCGFASNASGSRKGRWEFGGEIRVRNRFTKSVPKERQPDSHFHYARSWKLATAIAALAAP